MAEDVEPGEMPVTLVEARSWLRMGAGVDDAVVARLIRAATNIGEAFMGRSLIRREMTETAVLVQGAVTLQARPVEAVEAVDQIGSDGASNLIAADDWRLDIGRDGTARIIVAGLPHGARIRVRYRAGMAADADAVPEAIRHGLLRMVQFLHEARDDDDAGGPPAMVAALWLPWRRMTLGGGR